MKPLNFLYIFMMFVFVVSCNYDDSDLQNSAEVENITLKSGESSEQLLPLFLPEDNLETGPTAKVLINQEAQESLNENNRVFIELIDEENKIFIPSVEDHNYDCENYQECKDYYQDKANELCRIVYGCCYCDGYYYFMKFSPKGCEEINPDGEVEVG